ncbi:MAG: OmpA family protein [Treponema sp.]|nr:OmpA family protein [Treponema sp.]MCL2252115.1 OmpA family protein [Treponema sp.]
MKKVKLFSIFSFFIILSLIPVKAQGDIFEFKHEKGSRYRILSVVDQAVYINGVLSHRAEILNRIAVDVTDLQDGKGVHKAVFQTSERIIFDSQLRQQSAVAGFQWSREYESVFARDKLGRLTIDPQYYMPVVRNVPVFPDKDLKVGETWRAEGHEVHDFRDAFGIPEPYQIPFIANYEYIGEREWKGKSYPSFSISYRIASRPPAVRGRLYPTRIYGEFNQLVYWDHSLGQPAAYEETFRITFEMSDRITREFRGLANAEFIESENMNKENIIAEITEELKRHDITDVNVRAVEEGISISLENIQFYADSDRMLPGEHVKLNRIAGILMRYPSRDIQVSGHAALAGSREYLLNLSWTRARAVADYLLSRNVRTADRMVIRGYGADRPIADNSTEAGMSRNRRVEITILEN